MPDSTRPLPPDIEIARSSKMLPIQEVAGRLKIGDDDLKKLKHYFDIVVRQRSKDKGGLWAELGKARKWLW